MNVRREGWRFWEEADVGFMVWCREGVGNMGLVVEELAGGAGGNGIGNGGVGGNQKGVEGLTSEEVCREWHVHVGGERCGKGKPKIVWIVVGASEKRKASAGPAGDGSSARALKNVKK